ncbi:MAG: hypothetical protein LBU90_10625 [Bacteroidales bacterium]|jgi:hypothetical protein|nr:hypothetical protein [Bacteroidales bacterium]
MGKLKRIWIVLLIFVCATAHAQDNNIFIRSENNPELKVTINGYFGISLLTQYNSFIRYAFIQIKSTGEQKITYLSREQFLEQVQGKMVSKANPDKVNFLDLYKIDPESFENLWKLRYSEFPYDGDERSREKGWAGLDFAPTPAQWSFLSRNYGFSSFDQLLYGENMWKLVKDSQAQAWQAQYKSLK